MKESKKIVVVGSSNTDMVIRTREFPRPGETVMGEGFMTNNGGKGANQAVATARLGAEVAFVAKLGHDANGDSTIAKLRSEGIDVTHVTQTALRPSGVALITINSGGENTIIVDSGANNLLSPADIADAASVIQDAAVMLMQLETPIPTLIAAAREARNSGATVVLNPAPMPDTPLPAELLENTDILIPNEGEAAKLTGITISDEQTAREAIMAIRRMGVQTVIVTVGKRGAITLEGDRLITVPAVKADVVDTTAAGDTFCGALCVALCEGRSLTDAIAMANRAAAVTVSRMGAQQAMPHRADIGL